MPFLTVNGIELPVSTDNARFSREEIGARERAFDGSLRSHRRATKRRIDLAIPVGADADTMHAYEGLLRGDGHVWGFETGFGLYSYKGLGPSAGFMGATQSGTGGKYGGKLTLAATTGTITFATGLPGKWSVMVWRFEGAAWVHYVVRSDGAKWVDGVRNDAASTGWLSASSGAVTLANSLATAFDYDDLVAVPYLVPVDWPAIVSASARAYSQLPRLECHGDGLPDSSASAPVQMMGEPSEATFAPVAVTGGWGRDLPVVLREV